MRSIALDPEYAPAYFHVVQGGLRTFGPDTVRAYAEKMLALRPDTGTSAILETVLQLLRPGGSIPDSLRAIVAREPAKVLQQTAASFRGAADTAEIGLVLERGFLAKAEPDPWWQVHRSIVERQYGRLRASQELLEKVQVPIYGQLHWSWNGAEQALLHSTVPANYQAAYERSLQGPFPPDRLPAARAMLPLWAEAGDTTQLRRYERAAESYSLAPSALPDMRRELSLARAYLALGRRDSSAALAQMLALPDSLYDDSFLRMTRANLLVAAGRDAEAAKQLENPFMIGFPLGLDGLRMMQRGRVAERLGRREVAVESYQWVADVWRRADPELQPLVAEARAALERLTAEQP